MFRRQVPRKDTKMFELSLVREFRSGGMTPSLLNDESVLRNVQLLLHHPMRAHLVILGLLVKGVHDYLICRLRVLKWHIWNMMAAVSGYAAACNHETLRIGRLQGCRCILNRSFDVLDHLAWGAGRRVVGAVAHGMGSGGAWLRARQSGTRRSLTLWSAPWIEYLLLRLLHHHLILHRRLLFEEVKVGDQTLQIKFEFCRFHPEAPVDELKELCFQ